MGIDRDVSALRRAAVPPPDRPAHPSRADRPPLHAADEPLVEPTPIRPAVAEKRDRPASGETVKMSLSLPGSVEDALVAAHAATGRTYPAVVAACIDAAADDLAALARDYAGDLSEKLQPQQRGGKTNRHVHVDESVKRQVEGWASRWRTNVSHVVAYCLHTQLDRVSAEPVDGAPY